MIRRIREICELNRLFLKRKKFINPGMTVLDVISRYRKTEAVFRQYDEQAGECVCCQALFESIRNVAKRYDLDMGKLMDDLNAAVLSANREPDQKADQELIKGK